MISEKLVRLIMENADELTRRLCRDLSAREETSNYKKLNQDIIYERAYAVYSRLDTWLKHGKSPSSGVRDYFVALGRNRCREGIPLREELMTLMLIKRHLWLFVLEKHFFDSSYELQLALQFNNRVVMFFDRVIYYVSSGYEQEKRAALGM